MDIETLVKKLKELENELENSQCACTDAGEDVSEIWYKIHQCIDAINYGKSEGILK